MIKKYFAMSVIAASVALAGCSDDDDKEKEVVAPTLPDVTEGGGSAYDTIAGSTSHTVLLAAINSIADLDKTLDNPASKFTMFAPTDTAFQAFIDADADDEFATTADLTAAANQAALIRILDGHIVEALADSGAISAAASDGTEVATRLTDAPLTFAATTTTPAATSGFDVIGADSDMPIALNTIDQGSDLSMGVVHNVDTVIAIPAESTAPIDPPGNGEVGTAAEVLAAGAGYEIFASAFNLHYGTNLVDSAWTAFLPSDATLGAAGIDDLTAEQIQALISTSAVAPAALSSAGSFTAFSGDTYTVETDAEGAMTIGGFPTALIAVGAGGAQLYSVGGDLTATAE